MNRKERQKSLNCIIKSVDSFINKIKKYNKNMVLAKEITDISIDYPKETIQDILVDCFETSDELMEIFNRLDCLRQEVSQHISEMKDRINKDEWDNFYYNMVHIEDSTYVVENNICTIDDYIDTIVRFRNTLEQLLQR